MEISELTLIDETIASSKANRMNNGNAATHRRFSLFGIKRVGYRGLITWTPHQHCTTSHDTIRPVFFEMLSWQQTQSVALNLNNQFNKSKLIGINQQNPRYIIMGGHLVLVKNDSMYQKQWGNIYVTKWKYPSDQVGHDIWYPLPFYQNKCNFRFLLRLLAIYVVMERVVLQAQRKGGKTSRLSVFFVFPLICQL